LLALGVGFGVCGCARALGTLRGTFGGAVYHGGVGSWVADATCLAVDVVLAGSDTAGSWGERSRGGRGCNISGGRGSLRDGRDEGNKAREGKSSEELHVDGVRCTFV